MDNEHAGQGPVERMVSRGGEARSPWPSYCCQRCGKTIGWLGRAIEAVFGDTHDCMTPCLRRETMAMRSKRINEAGRRAMSRNDG